MVTIVWGQGLSEDGRETFDSIEQARSMLEHDISFIRDYGESCMSDSETTIITVDVKLRVQHRDGRIETLHIAKPVSMLEGSELDRIVCSDGTEHFFTKDGYYDGWGTGAPAVRGNQLKKES